MRESVTSERASALILELPLSSSAELLSATCQGTREGLPGLVIACGSHTWGQVVRVCCSLCCSLHVRYAGPNTLEHDPLVLPAKY